MARALAAVPRDRRGVLSLGASRTGAEVALGWRPRAGVEVSGYGAKAWRGGWDAGVIGRVIW